MRMRRREREVLVDAHHDAGQHPRQQNHDTEAHHQRSDHPSFLGFLLGFASRREPELTRFPRLCDLMSLTGLAYLFLGIEPVERFNG
jgi:hypothetical protein